MKELHVVTGVRVVADFKMVIFRMALFWKIKG